VTLNLSQLHPHKRLHSFGINDRLELSIVDYSEATKLFEKWVEPGGGGWGRVAVTLWNHTGKVLDSNFDWGTDYPDGGF
jgi:hypothetical protein